MQFEITYSTSRNVACGPQWDQRLVTVRDQHDGFHQSFNDATRHDEWGSGDIQIYEDRTFAELTWSAVGDMIREKSWHQKVAANTQTRSMNYSRTTQMAGKTN